MTTIKKTFEIPADHRLLLDLPLPEDIPAGPAEIHVTITPYPEKSRKCKPFDGLAGSLKDSAIFGRDGVTLQREMRDEER
jgi:hypothetical protein